MNRRARLIVAFVGGSALAGLTVFAACGPPPEGWDGAGRIYQLQPAATVMTDGGGDGSADGSGGMDSGPPPPPDTGTVQDTGRVD